MKQMRLYLEKKKKKPYQLKQAQNRSVAQVRVVFVIESTEKLQVQFRSTTRELWQDFMNI